LNFGENMSDHTAMGEQKTSDDISDKAAPVAAPAHDVEKYTGNRSSVVAGMAGAGPIQAGQILEMATVIENHPLHPHNWHPAKKWFIITCYCLLQVLITMTSTAYVGIVYNIEDDFNVDTQVATLGQSLYIIGQAIAPLLFGPLSDLGGRKWVYVGSIGAFTIWNFSCGFAVNMGQLAFSQFISGCLGSTAVTNLAGQISDLFGPDNAGWGMIAFVASANIGPSIGGIVGEAISLSETLSWRWLFYLNIILGGAFTIGMCFLPETLPSIVIARQSDPNDPETKLIRDGRANLSIWRETKFVTTTAIKLLLTEPIVIALGLANGFAYGLLFLVLDAIFPIYAINYGLDPIPTECTYLCFTVGVILLAMFYPVQNYLYKRDRKKNGGAIRPEARFLTSLVWIWFFPISLFWMAYTSSGTNTSYWSPIIAATFLGIADPLAWLSMLTYLTDSYPSVAASAIAAFTLPSFVIAGALSHAGVAMFTNLDTQTGLAILAGVSFGLVIIIYVLYFFGHWFRKRSPMACETTYKM